MNTAALLVEKAKREAAAVVETGLPVFVLFSGGKDSLALAQLFRPWRERVRLVWCNTGHMAPHMVEFVRGYAREFPLTEIVGPDLGEDWRRFGPPAEVVEANRAGLGVIPAESVAASRAGLAMESGLLMQTMLTCCNKNRIGPAIQYVLSRAPCVLVHGERAEDSNGGGLNPVAPIDDVVSFAPLWDWRADDVMAYLRESGRALPPHYGQWANSIECLICPARLTRERLDYLDRHAPEAAHLVRETAARSLRHAQEAIERYVALLAL